MSVSIWALRGVVQDLTVLRGLPLDEAITQAVERNVAPAERHEASEALRSMFLAEAREEDEPQERLVLVIPDRTQLSLFTREG